MFWVLWFFEALLHWQGQNRERENMQILNIWWLLSGSGLILLTESTFQNSRLSAVSQRKTKFLTVSPILQHNMRSHLNQVESNMMGPAHTGPSLRLPASKAKETEITSAGLFSLISKNISGGTGWWFVEDKVEDLNWLTTSLMETKKSVH